MFCPVRFLGYQMQDTKEHSGSEITWAGFQNG
jgi:hypothetical protein